MVYARSWKYSVRSLSCFLSCIDDVVNISSFIFTNHQLYFPVIYMIVGLFLRLNHFRVVFCERKRLSHTELMHEPHQLLMSVFSPDPKIRSLSLEKQSPSTGISMKSDQYPIWNSAGNKGGGFVKISDEISDCCLTNPQFRQPPLQVKGSG